MPADRAVAFAQLAREKINGALVRCDERYPQSGPHSVLVVVVERDAAPLREQLEGLHREQGARKLKMARLLAEGGLEEEARAALLTAILPLARALAVENRLPEPSSAAAAALPPLSHHWQEAAPLLRRLVANPNEPLQAALECLAKS